MINLGDKLHVAIFDAIVNHLDKMAGAALADPVATRRTVHFGRDRLKDGLDVRPGFGGSTGHDRRTVASAIFTAGNTSAQEMETWAKEQTKILL